jgi:hypothetical protein
MKLAAVVLLAGSLWAKDAQGEMLKEIRAVYVMPMSRGLDQYVASRLTRSQALQVVTDAALADAVFTDHLGEGLKRELDQLFPQAPAVGSAEEKERPRGKEAGPAIEASEEIAMGAPKPVSTFSRSRGTVFLVDRGRRVVWSFYRIPKNSTPQEMDRLAEALVKQLMKDLNRSAPAKN